MPRPRLHQHLKLRSTQETMVMTIVPKLLSDRSRRWSWVRGARERARLWAPSDETRVEDTRTSVRDGEWSSRRDKAQTVAVAFMNTVMVINVINRTSGTLEEVIECVEARQRGVEGNFAILFVIVKDRTNRLIVIVRVRKRHARQWFSRV